MCIFVHSPKQKNTSYLLLLLIVLMLMLIVCFYGLSLVLLICPEQLLYGHISDQMDIHLLLLFSNIVFKEKFRNIHFCQDLDDENSADEAE